MRDAHCAMCYGRTASGSNCLPRPSRVARRASRELPPFFRSPRLHVRHVLVELGALIGREDVAHVGDALLEALLELGAACGHAGRVTALALRASRTVRAVPVAVAPRPIREELLALLALQIGELGLLVSLERDPTEQHALRTTTAAAADAVLLCATRALGARATLGALRTGGGGDREGEGDRRRQRSMSHLRDPR